MNIISSKEQVNRMVDGINTILSLPEEEYRIFIKRMLPSEDGIEELRFFYLTDSCEMPTNPNQIGLEKTYDENHNYISRAYFGGNKFSVHEILEYCKSKLNNYPLDSIEYSRINEIIQTRNLERFKQFYSSRNDVNSALIDKTFQILLDDDMLSKFLNYEENKETFAIEGEEISQLDYLKVLGKILGKRNDQGELNLEKRISRDFYIPEFEEIKNRYFQILDNINMERFTNPKYTFTEVERFDEKVIREGNEPVWTISPEIYQEIFQDMPQELSLEEKAMHIYCKMCQIFRYDEGYVYRDKLNKVNYESTFSKEHLESLRPGSKITCFDFSRMYAKLINELDGDITAVMILQGINEGHALAGFYTENVSATVEGININSDKDATNDLMKAKNGINLEGIKIISDKKGILEGAINKVYSQILGEKPKSIKEYIEYLKSTQQEQDVPEDVTLRLQSFLEVMKSKQISGNELTQTLWGINKTKWFRNAQLEMAYLGELREDEKRYKRHILLRQKDQEIKDGPKEVYLIDTDTLDFTISSEEEIIAKLNSGELIYESKDHKLPGIDKGEER